MSRLKLKSTNISFRIAFLSLKLSFYIISATFLSLHWPSFWKKLWEYIETVTESNNSKAIKTSQIIKMPSFQSICLMWIPLGRWPCVVVHLDVERDTRRRSLCAEVHHVVWSEPLRFINTFGSRFRVSV